MSRFKTSSSGAAGFLRRLPLFACCLFAAVRADAKIDSPFLWRLTTPGCVESWVFGSIHIPSRALQKLPASVTNAFAESGAVICELPFNSATLKKIAQQSAGASEPLSKRLPPDLYSRSERLLQRVSPGFPLSSLDQMQLWAFTFSIFLFEHQIQNIGVLPMDDAFYKRAVAAGKQTGGLESAEEQLAAIRSFTEEEIIAMLRYALDDDDDLRKKGEKPFDRLLAAYCTGSEKKLLAEAERTEAHYSPTLRSRFEKIMLDDRNQRMTERIRKHILAQPEMSHFFVIGTLHCLGKGSVIDRLPALGTSVQRLDR